MPAQDIMQKRIAFVVGHENWGKSRTLSGLKEICESRGRRLIIRDTEFLVRSMSNDDKPDSYIDFMNSTSRPAIIAALCPKFKKLKNYEDSRKSIDETLQFLRQRGYHLFFWVIEHQWAGTGRITQEEIEELRRNGVVEVFEGRNVESKSRARRFRAFVSDVVLA
jgi:hypothetical protein